VKLRHRSPAVRARIAASAGRLALDLDQAVYGVAPGQTAVVYEGDVVVGSGVVSGSAA
jgi:tRNA-uridine 2-sulfurtransferase